MYYGALSVEGPQVWFRFEVEVEENQKTYFSVGIPFIERLRGHPPAVALISPVLEKSGLDPD